ncbi:MAG: DegT/DnrJ/EryC1/StrS family aminotransferase [Acidobacteria bacterium]|nr:DegT/DnrJ/EryC1/StrS family aminotransferase [Acidobacteriota bacterium]
MSIPLVDLVAQYRSIRGEIDHALHAVLESGTFILGPQVKAFEEELAAYLGVRYAVGVASGTDALILTLRACGIGETDEVILPVYTFVATAGAVSQVGATPVFVDVDPRTYCLDAEQVEAAVTPRTRAIIPVHLFGHPADLAPILDVAARRRLRVIEDNAQALGAEYRGRKTGALGDAGCLSFFPSKNLGGYGDGGMVVTNDPMLADTIQKLRTHGGREKYQPEMSGFNSRLDELQAAILRVKLRHLAAWSERRRWIAGTYRTLLADIGAELPQEAPYARHVYHLYVLRTSQRDAVRDHLRSCGIASGVYYPRPLHRLAPYRRLGGGRGFPHAELAAEETVAIPLYPEMGDDQINAVVSAVRAAVAPAASPR